MHPKLFGIIAKEFVRTWAPTSDYRIARSGPFATFQFARFLAEMPSRWGNLPRLPMFQLENARSTLAAVDRDAFINHWQGIPLALWSLLFIFVGIGRLIHQRLSPQLFIVAVSFLAIGTIADLATCALAYAQPRYTLPLLITVFVSGCVLLFGTNRRNRIRPGGTSTVVGRFAQAAGRASRSALDPKPPLRWNCKIRSPIEHAKIAF
jgi:hypothetical protein